MVGVRGPEAGVDPPLLRRPRDGLFAVGGRLGHQRRQQAGPGRHQHLLYPLLLLALADKVRSDSGLEELIAPSDNVPNPP